MSPQKSFSTTVSQMWATRPPRIPKKQGGRALIAGVCEGIGARYNVDPVLIRLAFVAMALAFGGGVFLYLFLWINMPLFGTSMSPWRAMNTAKDSLNPTELAQRRTGWKLLCSIALLYILVHGQLEAIATFALSAVALYLLHRRTPVPPEGLLPAGQAPHSASVASSNQDTTVDTSSLSVPEGYQHPAAAGPTPPAWDPLGAAPQLWYLPEPHSPVQEESPAAVLPPRRPNKLALAVLGIVIILGAATVGGTRIVYNYADRADNVGETTTVVTAASDLAAGYDTTIGDTRLDLSGLEPLGEDRTVLVTHDVGTLTIIAPREVRTTFDCAAHIGEASCPGTLHDDADGHTLNLTVRVNVGEIQVEEAED